MCSTLQIAPVADAGSAQSRADVLLIGMSGAIVLTGLQVNFSWLYRRQIHAAWPAAFEQSEMDRCNISSLCVKNESICLFCSGWHWRRRRRSW